MEGDCTGAVVSVHFWNVMYWIKVRCHDWLFPAISGNYAWIDAFDDKGRPDYMLKSAEQLSKYNNPYHMEDNSSRMPDENIQRQLPPYSYYAKDGDMLYLDVYDVYCPRPWLFFTFMFKHRCVLILRNNDPMYGNHDTNGRKLGRTNDTTHFLNPFHTTRHALFLTNQAILLNISALYIPGTHCGYYMKQRFDKTQWDFHYDINCTMSSGFDHKLIMATPRNDLHQCLVGHFRCEDGVCILIEYKCDGIKQCSDESDERNCSPICDLPVNDDCIHCNRTTCKCTDFFYQCETGGCIPLSKLCNHIEDCKDGSDENICTYGNSDSVNRGHQITVLRKSVYESSVTHMDGDTENKQAYSMCINDGRCDPDISPCNHLRYCYVHECPGHFKCYMSYCIPYWLICNGKKDCPYGEDEAACGKFLCRDMFKCIHDNICVSLRNVCDGIKHCSGSGEDEMLCDTIDRPGPNCDILGNAVVCKEARLNKIPILSGAKALLIFQNDYLEISGLEFQEMVLLVVLKLVACSISSLPSETFGGLEQLHDLDLSWNMLTVIVKDDFQGLHNVQKLNLANNKVRHLQRHTLSYLVNLRVLHLEGNEIDTFEPGAFVHLVHLDYVQSDKRIICCFCPAAATCIFNTETDGDVFNCDRLLASPYTRTVIWLLALAIVSLNSASFYANSRLWLSTKRKYYLTYTYLNSADCSMGLYLLTMGIVDSLYQNEYAAIDSWWRHSWQCKVAGFLALLSMEASNVAILCVTITRYIGIRLPFTYKKYKWAIYRTTLTVMLISIAFSVGKAFIMDTTSAMCLFFMADSDAPLHIFNIIYVSVVLNASIFIAILLFSMWMMCAIHNSSRMSGSVSKKTEQRLVKRTIILSITNFISWFTICVITLLNSNGHAITREIIMWSMLVIPSNAVLNPLIYCFTSADIGRVLFCGYTTSLAPRSLKSTEHTATVANTVCI